MLEPGAARVDNEAMRRAWNAALLLSLVLGCAPHATSDRGAEVRPDAVAAASESTAATPEIVTLEVGGMTCQSCVARVRNQIASVPGVRRVDVSLADQRAQVLVDPSVPDTALTGAVRRAGSEYLGIVVHR